MIGSEPGVKREKSPRHIPTVLTIAGSDSGGGAGIQADLKAFAAIGVHGTAALTCVTAQNPRRVLAIQPCDPAIVRDQLRAVTEELNPVAAKTGMLYSAAIIRAVAEFLRNRTIKLVVDPVMISTSGAKLLRPAAIQDLCRRLLPLATLITPNIHEAEALLKTRLTSVEHLRKAARELQRRYGAAALVKGGHLRGLNQAVDIFYDGRDELLLSAPFVRGVHTHGTGCTYSAAIAAYLAAGLSLARSVAKAKEFVTQAIAGSQTIGRHSVLNSHWQLERVENRLGWDVTGL
jgi:hydroxymethylpyrimidine/phosphomethylpyrimidine kinase